MPGGSADSAAQIINSPSPELASAVADEVISYLLQQRIRRRRRLSGLKIVAFQHPVDRALMSTIKTLPGIETLLKKFVSSQARNEEVNLAGRALPVGPRGGLAPLHNCFVEACEALDISPVPRLFVEQGMIGTRSVGIDNPSVVITSSTISFLTRDELLFALGREIGHIKAGHLVYNTMAEGIRNSADLMADFTLGLSKLAESATITPLLSSWLRRAELTADRAGFLACQDREVALRCIMKVAGYPPSLYREMHSRLIVQQVENLQELLSSGLMNRFFKVSQLWNATKPFPVVRAWELMEWLRDGSPQEILEMSPEQLSNFQTWQTDDPVMAEFIYSIVRILSDWVGSRNRLNTKKCRGILRRILLDGQSVRDTILAFILQISLTIEKDSPDSATFALIVILNEGGKAMRTRIPIERSQIWDDVPKQYREEFIRSGQTTLDYSLYSA